MSFFFRLLTVVELIFWLKRLKETNDADVAQTGRQDSDRVCDCNRPTRSHVLDDVQAQSCRHPSCYQSTQSRQDPHQERNL